MTSAGAGWLSCYTAAVHAYLSAEWDADELVARSVHFAIRPTDLAVSHHGPALDRPPDGTCLRWASASSPEVAFGAIATELDARGRVLVMTDWRLLPWSVARERAAPSPHLIVLTGRAARRWCVADRFAALLPEGEQHPHEVWLDDTALADALRLPSAWSEPQARRNALALGAPVPLAPGPTAWLERSTTVDDAGYLDCHWVAGDDALALVHELVADAGMPVWLLDDLWAAAGHHAFAHSRSARGPHVDRTERVARTTAVDAWERLPQVLRVVDQSAARGRARPALARAALGAVREAERQVQACKTRNCNVTLT